ncbi:MAG: fused MFS/spermidine synthase [Reinekea sp.]
MTFGKEILRRYDELGPVQVFDNGNKRTLMFGDDDEQGCVLKRNPAIVQYSYIRAMLLAMVFHPDAENSLLLGLGSGALAQALFHFWPGLQIDVVELRQLILELAHSHFYLPRDERIHLMQSDAGAFMAECQAEPYELIFSDLYLAEGMDSQQATAEFFAHCKNQLTPDGTLVLNYWADHRALNLLPILQDYFIELRTNYIADSDNWIIFAHKKTIRLTTGSSKQPLRR